MNLIWLYACNILRRLHEEYHAKGEKLYAFCGPKETSSESIKKSVGMGNGEEINTICFG